MNRRPVTVRHAYGVTIYAMHPGTGGLLVNGELARHPGTGLVIGRRAAERYLSCARKHAHVETLELP